MINTILIYGDDTQKSYERKNILLLAARKRGWEVVHVAGNGNTFRSAITNPVLFASDRLIYVDKFSNLSEKDLKFLNNYHDKIDVTLLIYNEGSVTATKIKSLPKTTKKEKYDLPVLLWKFLDSLFPGNSDQSLKLFNDIAKSTPVEFVFSLIAKLYRDLYWAGIPNSKLPYPPWRKGKLSAQAKKYPDGLIKDIINDLADIDIKVKTSRANLKDNIDLLIVKHLE